MAEAAAAFSTAVSALDLIALAVKVFQRYQDYLESGHTVPKNLQNVANSIPYLRRSLERHAQAEVDALKSGNDAELGIVFAECRVILGKLQKFIDDLIPLQDDGKRARVKKAIKSIRQESELKRVQDDLQAQISALSYGALVKITAHRCIGKPIAPAQEIHRAPLKPTYGVPTSKVSKFIGRRSIVKLVEEKLMVTSTSRNVVVLQGMGGQGKTQIALEICERQDIRQHFKVVLWVNAGTEDTTAQAFEHFARSMCLQGSSFSDSQSQIDYVKERLEDSDRPCLLIFDNYDDLETFKGIRNFFPRDNRHSILITSRHEDSTHLGLSISISKMDENEANALLLHRSGLDHDAVAAEHAKGVARHLGYLPLALAQAGAYVKSRRIPLSAFVDHYEKRASAVLKQTPDIWEYGVSVFTTWEMSMSQYSKNREERDQVDCMLLLLAILHHETINEQYFGHLLECMCKLPDWARRFETDGHWDGDKLQDTLAKLARLSLLQIVNWKSGHYDISIHPMVSDWLKLRVTDAKLVAAVAEAMEIVAAFIKCKHGRLMTFELRREIRVYIGSCMRNYGSLYDRVDRALLQTPSIIEAKLTFAEFCQDDCRWSNATRLYRECVEAYKERIGAEDPRTIRAMKLEADYHTEHGSADYAAELQQSVLACSKEKASIELAKCYRKQGKHEEAQEEYRKALAELESDLTQNDLRVIHCRVQVALNEKVLSSCDAEGPLTNALNRLEERSSHRSGKVMDFDEAEATLYLEISQELLSIFAEEQEDYVKAERLLCRALEVAETLHGAENGATLRWAHNLAIVYNNQAKLLESERMYQRTLDGYEAFYGPESEVAMKACHCYGHVLGSQYRLLEATNLHLRAVNGLQKLYGVGHDLVMAIFDCLVSSYIDIGDELEAEKLYKTALANRTKVLGMDHEKTFEIALALGKLYSKQQRLDEAEGLLRQAVDGYYNAFGSADEKIWPSMESLFLVLYNLGRLEEAAGLCEDLLWQRERHYPYHDIHVLDDAHNLSKVLHELGREDEVDALHQVYNEAFDAVLEKTERGEADVTKAIGALDVRDDDASASFDEEQDKKSQATIHEQAGKQRNPFFTEEGDLKRLTEGLRCYHEETIPDKGNPGKTKVFTGYPYLYFKPEGSPN
ncbi:MAG: hypothetical protein Q9195_006498 [Heterodermia aff. obscurata]